MDSSQSTFELGKCDSSFRLSEVRVDVSEAVDLSDDGTARLILERAAEFARDKCRWTKGYSNIVAFIVQPGNVHARECYLFSVNTPTRCIVRGRNYEEDKLTWGEYTNYAFDARVARAREEARKKAEAERGKAKVPISRTIEGFSIGMTREQALARLKQGWGREYLPYVADEREMLWAPMWFSGVRSGEVGRVTVGKTTTLEGIYFRTSTTKYVALYFYRGTLYQVTLGPLGVPPPILPQQDEVFGALRAKYGEPGTDPRRFRGYFWQDAETVLDYESISARRVSYTDRRLLRQIEDVEEEVKREEQERIDRERKTLPKGY
ncbi:MAG TPA: hypothetical protein VJO34_05405 [Methylomirabilota bacterium]|nr:hypothetical protein [Methylomirabilota bacterium]